MADSSTGSCTAALKGEVGMEDKDNGSRIRKAVAVEVGYYYTVLARTAVQMLDHGARGMRTRAMLLESSERRSPSHWC